MINCFVVDKFFRFCNFPSKSLVLVKLLEAITAVVKIIKNEDSHNCYCDYTVGNLISLFSIEILLDLHRLNPMISKVLLKIVFVLCDGTLERGEAVGVNNNATVHLESTVVDNLVSNCILQKNSPITIFDRAVGNINSNCKVELPNPDEYFNLTNHEVIFGCKILKGTTIDFNGVKTQLSTDIYCHVKAQEMIWIVQGGFLVKEMMRVVRCIGVGILGEFTVEAAYIILPEEGVSLFDFIDNSKPPKFIVDQDGVTYTT